MLTFLAFLVIATAFFFYGTIVPARSMKNWLAALANGEKVPSAPAVGWRIWLHGLYREAEAVGKKMDEVRTDSDLIRQQLRDAEFMQNFILGSLIEGIMVVDSEHKISLVNSEFLNIFQLEESPIGQSAFEVVGDERLDKLISDVFKTAEVQSDRVSKATSSGRPPSFEVSAVPVRISATEVESVVVVFLPPPDRPRMVQILKLHTEKLHKLADTWTERGTLLQRASVSDRSGRRPEEKTVSADHPAPVDPGLKDLS